MLQLNLFPLADTVHLRTLSVEDNFRRFHSDNPQVYRAFVTLALDHKSKGMPKWSAVSIFEVLRWSALQTTGEEWLLNNNYRALYARKAMREIPALDGFFITREMKVA